MGISKIINGPLNDAVPVNSNFNFAWSRLLEYGLDGATATNQSDHKQDLFSTDTAQFLQFMQYDSGSDYYECIDTSTAYYVIIVASSLTPASFAINGCLCSLFSSGQWMLSCDTGTYEANRAKVMQTLFENGASSPLITDATTVTAIKTVDSDDINMRGHWATLTGIPHSTNYTYPGTFVDTTGNTISSWSDLSTGNDASLSAGHEVPLGVSLHSVSGENQSSNDFGTDTSADEKSDPANCNLQIGAAGSNSSNFTATCHAIFFGQGDITWVSGGGTDANYDFFTDGSIPDTTLATESDLTCVLITGTNTITTNETSIIARVIKSLTVGNTLVIEASFNGGTNYTTITEKEIGIISNTGTSSQLKLTITRANNSETDNISSYGYYYS